MRLERPAGAGRSAGRDDHHVRGRRSVRAVIAGSRASVASSDSSRAPRSAGRRPACPAGPGSSGSPYGQVPACARAVELLPGRRRRSSRKSAPQSITTVSGSELPRRPRPRRRAAGRGRRRRGRPASRRGRLHDPVGQRHQMRLVVPQRRPALAPAVTAPISTSGCASSSRSSSPPAYPVAPATATLVTTCMNMPWRQDHANLDRGAAKGPLGAAAADDTGCVSRPWLVALVQAPPATGSRSCRRAGG